MEWWGDSKSLRLTLTPVGRPRAADYVKAMDSRLAPAYRVTGLLRRWKLLLLGEAM